MKVYVVLECFDCDPGAVRVVGVCRSERDARRVEGERTNDDDGVRCSRWIEECEIQ